MKVHELIAALEAMPSDAPVMYLADIDGYGDHRYEEVEDVFLTGGGNVLVE